MSVDLLHEKYHGIFVHGTMVEYHGTWYGIKYHTMDENTMVLFMWYYHGIF